MRLNEHKQNRLVDFGTTYSMLIYIIMAVIKIVFGTLGKSQALFTDGLNSISDVFATIILYIGLKISRRPRDANHAYGHYRYESVSTLIAALVMFLIGGQALLSAIRSIFADTTAEPTRTALIASIISIILILSSTCINYTIAKSTNVSAARAVAKNNLSDAFTAFGAFIAIVTAQYNIPYVDTIASIIIAGLILQTAWSIFKEAGISLTDGFDRTELEQYKASLASFPEVLEVRDIKGRMLGNFPTLDIEIAVDGNMTVTESHVITDRIEAMFRNQYSIHRTHVHVEPFIDNYSYFFQKNK